MSEPAEVPHARIVGWQGLGIGISAPRAADLAWLLAFLVPWFDLDAGAADCRVELIADDAAYRRLASLGEQRRRGPVHCFSLDRGALRLPSATTAAGEEVVFDERLRCAYLLERRAQRVRIVAPADNLAARFAAMRVVRELAMEQARAGGHLLLHAGCVAAADDALLIAAPKGGGKTSVLLGGLLGGGFRFVSNDRVAVRRSAGKLVAHGIPTLVSIRRPTLEWNPLLRRRLEERTSPHWLTHGDEKSERKPADWSAPSVDVTPARVGELLGVEARASGRVRALLFPRIDGSAASGFSELAAPEAAERMSGALFGADGERTPGLFASLLPDRAGAAAPVDAAELIACVPGFEVVLGSDRTGGGRALAEILDRCAPATPALRGIHTGTA